ncbi:hypothetical protein O181_117236 [Austropuccinia psidii MF-1]|uniref:Uncharacterized protein n=1 Tax=Austropuccinia psidii MF-1 TaxID=1389203 RepID=A0A9Q3PXR8_9BASI|nr:hypothetical protein [Austropuccinia psidii MF-1]
MGTVMKEIRTSIEILSDIPFHLTLNRDIPPEYWTELEEVLQIHTLIKKMEKKRIKLAMQVAEFGTKNQKILFRDMTWVESMQRMNVSNPKRWHKFLEERASIIKDNQEVIQSIEEQWKELNLIQEGTLVEK